MQNRFKIVHSSPVWLPQTQTWMYNQIKYLPKEIETYVVCERTEHLEQFIVPNIHVFSEISPLLYILYKLLSKLRLRWDFGFLSNQIKESGAQILHSHFGHIGWMNMKAAQQANARHIVTFYGQDVNYLPNFHPHWHKRYKDLFAQVDGVLCEGSYMAQSLEELGCPKNKIQVHHLGIAIDEIPFQPRIWDSAGTLRILIAASFQEKKGIPYALEALGQLQYDVDLEITIIGDANREKRSQTEKKKILNIITKHNLQSKIRMLGYQPHSTLLAEAYKHHIFLSPSIVASDGDTEGGAPVALIEMAATGMLVVSTKHCDIPGVILHNRTGLLAEERDIDDLVFNLRRAVAHPEDWTKFIRTGREYIEAEFNASIQGRRLKELYQRFLI